MALYKRIRKIVTTLVIIAAAMLIFYFSFHYFIKLAYPLKYENYILKASKTHAVDGYLILAIIREESRFRQDSVSDKGAVGLMQIMPKTARWIQTQRKLPIRKITKPEVNIDYGSWYYNYLHNRYKSKNLALAAYNSGTSVMDRWLKKNPGANLDDFIYPETRSYVQRVNRAYRIYQKYYPDLEQ